MLKRILVFLMIGTMLFSGVISADAAVNSKTGTDLFVFKQMTGKTPLYGYMNATGKIILPAKYTYAEQFKDGLALIETGGKLNVINTSGKILLDAKKNYSISSPIGGLIPFYVKKEGSTKVGFLDSSGKVVTQPTLIANEETGIFSNEFYNGLALLDKSFDDWESPDEFINTKGVVSKIKPGLSYLNYGFCRLYKNDKVGVTDTAGKVIVDALYDDVYLVTAFDLYPGMVYTSNMKIVSIVARKGTQYFLFDSKGKQIYSTPNMIIGDENGAVVYNKNHENGDITFGFYAIGAKKGTDCIYDSVYPLNNSTVAVQTLDKKWSIVDGNGKVLRTLSALGKDVVSMYSYYGNIIGVSTDYRNMKLYDLKTLKPISDTTYGGVAMLSSGVICAYTVTPLSEEDDMSLEFSVEPLKARDLVYFNNKGELIKPHK